MKWHISFFILSSFAIRDSQCGLILQNLRGVSIEPDNSSTSGEWSEIERLSYFIFLIHPLADSFAKARSILEKELNERLKQEYTD
ncbi:hypothetical protein GDO81_024577 [Engystomops pustulosus]|uniref:Uncharacterized protein n=1 Tax=Engystomops pustulosus TaxID=76066 RepID=A0AAV6YQ94_ENGPU|nr:hypothetical protein GDO81_024577 [Engystomops pustulosus]